MNPSPTNGHGAGGEREAIIRARGLTVGFGEVKRLTAAFLPLYAEFDRPKVRREVALVLARL